MKIEKKRLDWHKHVRAPSLNMPSDNKSFYFLSSFKDDEPALAEEEGSSADSHTEDGYKTNNFLIFVIAGLARKQRVANCHFALFKVTTKQPTTQFQVSKKLPYTRGRPKLDFIKNVVLKNVQQRCVQMCQGRCVDIFPLLLSAALSRIQLQR